MGRWRRRVELVSEPLLHYAVGEFRGDHALPKHNTWQLLESMDLSME
jgi:hypothetical protein